MRYTSAHHGKNAMSKRAAVIGGGPAGLMAAEVLLARGIGVDIYDSMPSLGRKFLMAGKSGLNLTHTEAAEGFLARYGAARENLAPALREFDAAAIRAWSNDGGAIDVQSLDLVHGVLGLNGEGTLALDNDLQPIGAFTARIAGFQAAIDQLVAAGMVRPDDGKLAKVVLGVMAKVPKGGGPLQISLPLTLQDRKLSVGPLPLVRLPMINWE